MKEYIIARRKKIINTSISEISTEEVQLAAVQQDGRAIIHIKNPSEEVQLAAVQQNGWAISGIKNPCIAAKLASAITTE